MSNENHELNNIERGSEEPQFRVIVVDDDDVMHGAYGAKTSKQAGHAVSVLAETFALDNDLHIEVRQ